MNLTFLKRRGIHSSKNSSARKLLIFAGVNYAVLVGYVSIFILTQGNQSLVVHNPTQENLIVQTQLDASQGISGLMPSAAPINRRHFIHGRVIDLNGRPVVGAQVFSEDTEALTGEDGQFKFAAGETRQWVTIEHPNYLSRTRAAALDSPLVVRLTPDDGETISLHFVGDVMFGRRYYDPNEDGHPDDGLLRMGAGADDHLALLHDVQPLLQNADITVVNLESSLSEDPYINPMAPRPAKYHPTKEYVFSSHVSAAAALHTAGVDVIDIANNHLYDALDQGVADTLNALVDAGFDRQSGYFGAGFSEADAWEPAVVSMKGQTIAFLGCTTITFPFVDQVPQKDQIGYFASDSRQKGGAARCSEDRIYTEVRVASQQYDLIVFMVHGGSEYEREPTEVVHRMTDAARKAGAQLVVNHQPHVVSGLNWDGASLVAWSLGNFLFDQTVWPTYESYLLSVHVRHGEIVRAYVEPLMIEDFIPKGVTGEIAEFVARGAAGRDLNGPFVIENGAVEIDIQGRSDKHEMTIPLMAGSDEDGTIFQLHDGWWASDFDDEEEDIQLGRDLLWTGSFEDEDVDGEIHEGSLWEPSLADKHIGSAYAHAGNAGVRLQRGARSDNAIQLTPINRIAVTPETELSIIGMVRSTVGANLALQLSWYPDTRGLSTFQTVKAITIDSDNEWQQFRFDTTVPSATSAATTTVAVGLFIQLSPPLHGLVAADFDNIRLIEWADEAPFSPQFDYIRVLDSGKVTLRKEFLPDITAEVGTSGVPYASITTAPITTAPLNTVAEALIGMADAVTNFDQANASYTAIVQSQFGSQPELVEGTFAKGTFAKGAFAKSLDGLRQVQAVGSERLPLAKFTE